MRYAFVPIAGAHEQAPLAWAGPLKNLVPTVRKHLNTNDKQKILHRQRRMCNGCGGHIELYPVANCDADHILPVMRGGKTTVENMQLLCVTCHRRKTLHESKNSVKMVHVPFTLAAKKVYIFSREEELQFPADKKTPLQAVSQGCGLSLLTYEKKMLISPHATEFDKMLSEFVFKPV
ncbi:unnamed protein product [Ectocarpus sp. 6 AP-2014]